MFSDPLNKMVMTTGSSVVRTFKIMTIVKRVHSVKIYDIGIFGIIYHPVGSEGIKQKF